MRGNYIPRADQLAITAVDWQELARVRYASAQMWRDQFVAGDAHSRGVAIFAQEWAASAARFARELAERE